MFTGIVQAQCAVVQIDDNEGIRSLSVDLGDLATDLELGASVANNGVCLTASEVSESVVRFDVIQETLQLTNLVGVEVGDQVNVERSLKFGDELGGHMVSGHVSTTATVSQIETDGANRTMWFELAPEHMPFVLWKGWIAVDGISLTVSGVDRDNHRFAVSLIPETLARTTLGRIEVGAKANIELDAQTQAIVETVRGVLSDPELRSQILGSAE
ncbi:riboflavin synthase subunit alpha [Acidimicrobium ferrooxidans]|uniref:Riboflavin synthase n=1 Tax=Acidimicrobium ferrooxidans TaxID=53635 RepID=A0ABS3ATS9_9ACTN|nr:riboflavin synthase subunit alpha [Acidimicrobium ferrooxidans]